MTPEPGGLLPPNDTNGANERQCERQNAGLIAALAAFHAGNGGQADVMSALAASRVFIPIVDHRGEGAGSEAVTVDSDEGGGMLAFSTAESLHLWDEKARAITMPMRSAAEAALANGADALVLDAAGPARFTIDAPGLRSLASGWRPHISPHMSWPEARRVGSASTHEAPEQSDEPQPTPSSRPRRWASRAMKRFRRT